jgi:hypothetical protein
VGLGNLLSDEDMKLVEQYAEVQVQSFASDLEDAMANAESYCGLAGGVSLANGAPTVALGQVTTTHTTPYMRCCPPCLAPSRPRTPLQAFRCCRRVARAACAGRVLWAGLVTERRVWCNSIPAPGVFAGAMAGVQQPMLAGQPVQQPMQWPGSSIASRYMASPFPGMSLSQQATTGARITPVAGESTPQFMGATQVCASHLCARVDGRGATARWARRTRVRSTCAQA